MHPSTPAARPAARGRSAAPASGVRALLVARDDAALVAGLRAGETWAQAAFFDHYAPQVERILRMILGQQHHLDMADLVHDTFVRALSSIDRLRDVAALPAWMRTIATRVARRAIQARRVRRWLLFWQPEDLPEVQVEDVAPEVVEAYRRVYAVLGRMPPGERVAFALRFIDGMELTEAASACEVSLATFKRRLKKAEQRFVEAARRDDLLAGWLERGDRWTP